MIKCQEFFLRFNIKGYTQLKHSLNSQYYHWCYGPRPAYMAKNFLDIIYRNSTPESRLARKYAKANEIYTAAEQLLHIHKKPRQKLKSIAIA